MRLKHGHACTIAGDTSNTCFCPCKHYVCAPWPTDLHLFHKLHMHLTTIKVLCSSITAAGARGHVQYASCTVNDPMQQHRNATWQAVSVQQVLKANRTALECFTQSVIPAQAPERYMTLQDHSCRPSNGAWLRQPCWCCTRALAHPACRHVVCVHTDSSCQP